MKIETNITFKDHLHANFYFTFHRPLIILLCLVSLFFLVAIVANIGNIQSADPVSLVLALFLPVYMFIIVPIILYYRTKKIYESHKNLHKPITYIFADEHIELKSDDIHSTFPWENVYQVKESGNMIYIYQSNAVANLLPKRFFSVQQLSEFRDMVNNKGIKAKFSSSTNKL